MKPKFVRETEERYRHAKNAPDQPNWDPLRAEKDLDVGQYT